MANTDPSIEDIENLHQRYLEGLKDIFEEYKEKFGIDKDKHLEFIWPKYKRLQIVYDYI